MGEFVFDHGWADAAERAGIRYYPKLLAGVPFTPHTGRCFITAPGADRGLLIGLLARALIALCTENEISSDTTSTSAKPTRPRRSASSASWSGSDISITGGTRIFRTSTIT